MKIIIERPLDEGELTIVKEVLEEVKEKIEKEGKRPKDIDFELGFF